MQSKRRNINIEKKLFEEEAQLCQQIKISENEGPVEEGIAQGDTLSSIEVKFPEYYNKLKKIWSTHGVGSNYYVIDLKDKEILSEVYSLLNDEELKLLFDRLSLEDESKYMSTKSLEYMTLFDKIIYDYLRDENDDDEIVEKKFIELKDEAISKMEKIVYSLNGLTSRFNYLSYTLPIQAEQYEGFLYPDIHIIKSILSHLNATIRMDEILKDTTKRSWTAHILAYIFL
nr:11500_t:CDS:2 [Entrophospora candida]